MLADTESVRFSLRNVTRAAHEALEAEVGALDTPRAYLSYVRGLEAFRGPAEVHLKRVMDGALERRLLPTWLAADLSADRAQLGAAPLAAEHVTYSSDASSVLGALYVLEGSSLGARVLRTHVAALGLDETNGARHLWKQAHSLDAWKRLVEELESARDLDVAKACEGANALFTAARSAMRRAHDA